MIRIEEYLDISGNNLYRTWFDQLDVAAATRVVVALERMAAGHTGAWKALGDGVSEYKIDFGPGYRIYFGQEGQQLVILLGGGTKKKQSIDIESAKALWREYKLLKRQSLKHAAAKAGAPTAGKAVNKRR